MAKLNSIVYMYIQKFVKLLDVYVTAMDVYDTCVQVYTIV